MYAFTRGFFSLGCHNEQIEEVGLSPLLPLISQDLGWRLSVFLIDDVSDESM